MSKSFGSRSEEADLEPVFYRSFPAKHETSSTCPHPPLLPPPTGALYDLLGNYDAGFYFAGTMIFLSGAMLFAIPALQRRVERKKPTFDITGGNDQEEFVPDA